MSKTKQMVEAGLMLGGAALGAAGALFIEPAVIGAGVLAAGVVAVMRYRDHNSEQQTNKELRAVDGVPSR